MHRARRSSNNRHRPQGASSSPRSNSEYSVELDSKSLPSISPVMANAHAHHSHFQSATTNTTAAPHTAPQSRCASKTLLHPSSPLAFSTPGPNRPLNLRKRSRTMDDYNFSEDLEAIENGSPKKGGHSLRPRPRVDYTLEQIDDEVQVPSSSRSKKRKSEVHHDSEELYGPSNKKRGTSVDAVDTPSSRRRNPVRKSSELKAYQKDIDEDENNVQDTIEVGISFANPQIQHPFDDAQLEHHRDTSSSFTLLQDQDPALSMPLLIDPAMMEDHRDSVPMDPQLQSSQTELLLNGTTHKHVDNDAQDSQISTSNGAVFTDKSATATNVTPSTDGTDAALTTTAVPSSPVLASTQAQKSDAAENKGTACESSARLSPDPAEPKVQFRNSFRKTDEPLAIDTSSNAVKDKVQTALKSPLTQELREIGDSPVSPKAQDQDSKPALPSPNATVDAETPLGQIEQQVPNTDTDHQEDDKEPAAVSNVEQETAEVGKTKNHSHSQPTRSPSMPATNGEHANTSDSVESSSKEAVPEKNCRELEPPTVTKPTLPPPPPEQDPKLQLDPNVAVVITDSSGGTIKQFEALLPNVPVKETTKTDEKTREATDEPSATRNSRVPLIASRFKPQPRPTGDYSYLTPYLEGDYVVYPEKIIDPEDEAAIGEDQAAEEKDANDMEPMIDDTDDTPEGANVEAPTPAINTPMRGSPAPAPAVTDPAMTNSPAPAGDEAYEEDESQEASEKERVYKYRKLREADEFLSALENFENMPTEKLYEVLGAINVSLVAWQDEWKELGKEVDDYENSIRRRAADTKYEARMRAGHYDEPEFVVKGYKAKEKETMNETRYLQAQDRTMAAAYGFEYDPHPSKIGKQNPETQQVGIMTRGRSLRNQPKPTVKASEADEVSGRRQRKPVQLFDPVAQDASRSSTPAPARTRRRKVAMDVEENPSTAASSFNGEPNSDAEESGRTKRRRVARQKPIVPSIVEEAAPPPRVEEVPVRSTPARPTRKSRAKAPVKYDDAAYPLEFVEEEALLEPQQEPEQEHENEHEHETESKPKQNERRRILTLKIPKGKNFSEPSSAITDNGESRPTTADSQESTQTVESAYSLRPKRQKRFRDEPVTLPEPEQSPAKKKKRGVAQLELEEAMAPVHDRVASEATPDGGLDVDAEGTPDVDIEATAPRRVQKIKLTRRPSGSRKGTPSSQNGDEKDYKSMTKSEKMSASMKSRWQEGRMAQAVEKRKATLAAKKRNAQAPAEQKSNTIAPKSKTSKSNKKDSAAQDPVHNGASNGVQDRELQDATA